MPNLPEFTLKTNTHNVQGSSGQLGMATLKSHAITMCIKGPHLKWATLEASIDIINTQ